MKIIERIQMFLFLMCFPCKELCLGATTKSYNLQTTTQYTNTQQTLTNEVTLSQSTVKEKSTTSPCQLTIVGYRKCEQFHGSFCSLNDRGENRSFVSKNCSESFQTQSIEVKLKEIITLMEDENVYNTDKACLKAIRWLTCTTLFPDCTTNNTFINLPCSNTCEVVKRKVCDKTWHAYEGLQRLKIGHVVIPDCKIFPSKTNCSSPSFITELCLGATTKSYNLQTTTQYTNTQQTLTNEVTLSQSTVKEKSTTSPCQLTIVGYRKCEQFHGSFCSLNDRGENRSFVSKNCSESFQTQSIEVKLKEIITLMEDENVYNTDKACLKAIRWLTCTTLFPDCTTNNTFINLPCSNTCEVVKRKVCDKTWHAYEGLQRLKIGHVVIPDCKIFPSKTNCSSPSFITDIMDIQPKEKPANIFIIVGITTASILLVTVLILAIILCSRTKETQKLQRQLSMQEVKEVHSSTNLYDDKISIISTITGEVNPEYGSIERLVEALAIPIYTKDQLVFDEALGEGAFGKVVKCKIQNMPSETFGNTIDMVAVKYLKQNPSKEMEKTFQKEVEILSNFHHDNVIPLVGICLDGHMCLVLEFMKYGDLNCYIRLRSGSFHAVAGSYGNLPDGVEFNPPELSFHNLLLVTSQIADGLNYLAAKRFVHRDIATRNILVGENLRVKISDFGLAHDIYGSDYYRVDTQKMLPLRWLSPEALSLGKFTIYSDIWAFGVTMWEIFTYGMQPFYGCDNEEVCQRIRCHKVLERPYCCPHKIYDLMKLCWKFEPAQRKTCFYIKETISKWLQDEEKFIQESWQRLLLPPLPDRGPSIKKAKLKYLNIRTEITL